MFNPFLRVLTFTFILYQYMFTMAGCVASTAAATAAAAAVAAVGPYAPPDGLDRKVPTAADLGGLENPQFTLQ